MKKTIRDIIIIGAALFAMFFGAGNLIFPPAIGVMGADHWLLSFAGFFITGICLPILGVLAVSKAGGTINHMADKVSKTFSLILGTLIVLAIGPLLAIPRTGATVYEIGVKPLFSIHPLIVSVIYFAVVLFFVIKPSGIVDKIGKILTPILLLVIGLIIYKGIAYPIGSPITSQLTNPFSDGFIQGYQTMDTLGAILIGGIVLTGIVEKGYLSRKEQMKMAGFSGILAGFLLAGVYGGLLYLGATISGVVDPSTPKADLIIFITNKLLGASGQLVMCVAVSAACLTTSIGLTAIVGTYFEKLSRGKLSYKAIVIGTCVFSAIMGAVGVDTIVNIAVPFLVLAYPVVIVLIVFNMFDYFIPHNYGYIGGVIGALIIGCFDALKTIQLTFVMDLVKSLEPVYITINKLPLANMGFSWIVPSLVLAVVGCIIGKAFGKPAEKAILEVDMTL